MIHDNPPRGSQGPPRRSHDDTVYVSMSLHFSWSAQWSIYIHLGGRHILRAVTTNPLQDDVDAMSIFPWRVFLYYPLSLRWVTPEKRDNVRRTLESIFLSRSWCIALISRSSSDARVASSLGRKIENLIRTWKALNSRDDRMKRLFFMRIPYLTSVHLIPSLFAILHLYPFEANRQYCGKADRSADFNKEINQWWPVSQKCEEIPVFDVCYIKALFSFIIQSQSPDQDVDSHIPPENIFSATPYA